MVSGSFQASMLENSEAGSAKYRVYQTQIKDDINAWYPTTKDALEAVASQPQNLLYFHDSVAKAKGNQGLVALRMDDSTKTRSGMDNLNACLLFIYIILSQLKFLMARFCSMYQREFEPDTASSK